MKSAFIASFKIVLNLLWNSNHLKVAMDAIQSFEPVCLEQTNINQVSTPNLLQFEPSFFSVLTLILPNLNWGLFTMGKKHCCCANFFLLLLLRVNTDIGIIFIAF